MPTTFFTCTASCRATTTTARRGKRISSGRCPPMRLLHAAAPRRAAKPSRSRGVKNKAAHSGG
nr:MAG TPA: hypothetical protein [Siphoviridae sp. ctedi74]DAR32755.1 MAG TPA: hypothetical protein [Caudoviricetes sp.]